MGIVGEGAAPERPLRLPTQALLPPRGALMKRGDLRPVLDMLDEAAEVAQDVERAECVLEGYVMVDAVARERGLREQANRAEGGVTRLRARIGALTPDGRKGRSGKTSHRNDVLSSAERNQRYANKRLAKVGEARVAAVVERLVEAGERPTPEKVLGRATSPAPGGKYSPTAPRSNEHWTPGCILDRARAAMGGGFDLDPASCREANRRVQAARFFTRDDGGLSQEWRADRLWLNPPFSGVDLHAWVSRLVEAVESGRVRQACLLLHASTDSRYGSLALARCAAACFPRGRLQFEGPNPGRSGPQIGQMLLYYGSSVQHFVEAFREAGPVLVQS